MIGKRERPGAGRGLDGAAWIGEWVELYNLSHHFRYSGQINDEDEVIEQGSA